MIQGIGRWGGLHADTEFVTTGSTARAQLQPYVRFDVQRYSAVAGGHDTCLEHTVSAPHLHAARLGQEAACEHCVALIDVEEKWQIFRGTRL